MREGMGLYSADSVVGNTYSKKGSLKDQKSTLLQFF